MEALKKKWNSSRGASILIALLFLLVSMMVGVSVLMSAASNAGKIKSNREEQQKYLTLSSALTLICDELESVEYYGRYQHDQTMHEEPVTDSDESEDAWTYYEHKYEQKKGELRKKSGDPWELNETLPLYNDLDIIFAGQFKVPAGQQDPIDKYVYEPLKTDTIQLKSPHTLELAVTDSGGYGGLSEPVTVTVQLRNDDCILVTATLKNHPEYIMEAMLKPNNRLEQLLVPSGHAEDNTYETQPVKWTLEHIVKKEAADEETP